MMNNLSNMKNDARLFELRSFALLDVCFDKKNESLQTQSIQSWVYRQKQRFKFFWEETRSGLP